MKTLENKTMKGNINLDNLIDDYLLEMDKLPDKRILHAAKQGVLAEIGSKISKELGYHNLNIYVIDFTIYKWDYYKDGVIKIQLPDNPDIICHTAGGCHHCYLPWPILQRIER